MNNFRFSELKSLIDNNHNIIIVSHHNPDGDAVGSALAMYHYMNDLKKNATVVLPNGYPDFLNWMADDDVKLLIFNNKNNAAVRKHIENAELIVCVDFNNLQRTNTLEPLLREAKAKKVLIDHHIEPENEAFDFVFSKIETSSTAELVYECVTAMSGGDAITARIASCLYVGIITDTGSLSFSNNNADTYIKLAHLVQTGIDCALIQRLIYSNFSENRMRLFGECLNTNLFVRKNFKTAYIVLSIETLKKYKYKPGDTEGIVNYAMAIKGIECAALFVEREDVVRISFRSFGNLSVNHLARKHFAGGGHKNAAGANSYKSLTETVEIFNNILPHLNEFYI